MDLILENFDRVFIAFSGGKDSVASFIKTREKFPLYKICLVFSDTGHEMPETYQYLKWFDEHVFPVVRLTTKLVSTSETGRRSLENTVLDWDVSVSSYKEMGIITIFDEIRYRYNSRPDSPPWPTSGIRYCTKALKINLFFKYIHNLVPKDQRSKLLIVRGLRQEESASRSKTPELVLDEVGGDFYYFWHPVYDLTTEQVFELHRQHGIAINPVYSIRERSNCVGCPFARTHELIETVKVYPDILDEYITIERETGYTWKKNQSLEDIKLGVISEEATKEELLSCTSGYCDI